MLALMPRQVPPLGVILANIGNPGPRALARALGVSERSAQRWIAADEAPLPVLLALFWLTSWGASQVECQAVNAAAVHAQLVAALRAENDRLRAEIQRLVSLGSFGSANDPTQQHGPAPRPAVVLQFRRQPG